MAKLGIATAVAVLSAFTLIWPGTATDSAKVYGPEARLRAAYDTVPLSFEANRGQTDATVKFLARGGGYTLFLTPTEAVLTSPEASEARMRLVGANPAPAISGQGELPGRSHYLVGNDARKWRLGVPSYERIRYEKVYPGIDLIFYGTQARFEYDFVVEAHADPSRIRLEFPGANGLLVDELGDLVLRLDGAALVQRRPIIYQEVDGVRRGIDGGYRIDGGSRVSFKVGAYDESRPLVIDPVLEYATYLGGGTAVNVGDVGFAVTVDGAGCAYVTGSTYSLDFPVTAGAFQTQNGGGPPLRAHDAFVTKLNVDGTAIVFSTYLGGSGEDGAGSIVLDSAGGVYVAGTTTSLDFPTTPRAYQGTLAGISDAFVTKLSADGAAIVFSTYLGGGGQDSATGLAVDGEGSVHLGGWTSSADFPTSKQALQGNYGGGTRDAVVAKLNGSGTAVVHSTFLGGSGGDLVLDLELGDDGSVYVTGSTGSPDFPISAGAAQPAYAGSADAFVTRLNGNLKKLLYSTYLGGGGQDGGRGIEIDASGCAHVTGETYSADFPTTPDAYQPVQPPPDFGPGDAFVSKLTSGGGQLVYSTYLGGGDTDRGFDIALGPDACVYVTGVADSLDFPVTADALQPRNATPCFGNGCSDVFLTRLCDPGAVLSFSTYLGGSGPEHANAIALDKEGAVYLTGETASLDLPTSPGAVQRGNAGGPVARDAFVVKIGFHGGDGTGGFVTYDRDN